jgi:hypothetical protein
VTALRANGETARTAVIATSCAGVLIGGIVAVPLHHTSHHETAATVVAPVPSDSPRPAPSPSSTASGERSALPLTSRQLRERTSFTLMRSGGYSAEVTVSLGAAVPAGESPILTGSDDVRLAGGTVCDVDPNADAVIPVQLVLRNTSRAAATIAWQWGVDSSGDLSASQPQFETALPDQTFCAPSPQIPSSTLSNLTDPLAPGRTHVAIGFVVVHRYYSKAYPHGDRSRLQGVRLGINGGPDNSANRWMPINAGGPWFVPYHLGQLFKVELTVA